MTISIATVSRSVADEAVKYFLTDAIQTRESGVPRRKNRTSDMWFGCQCLSVSRGDQVRTPMMRCKNNLILLTT